MEKKAVQRPNRQKKNNCTVTFRFGVLGVLFIIFLIYFLNTSGVFADTTSILIPIGDGGEDSADWIGGGGDTCDTVDCYLEVDESSGAFCSGSDGDVSYVQSSVRGANQTFDIDESAIPDNSTITQIDITVCAVRGAPGANIQTRYCVDGSCANSGVAMVPGAAYTEATQSFSGLNIVKNVGTDIEIGFSNTAPRTLRVSSISAVLTYVPPDVTVPSGGGGGGGGGGVAPTRISFSGQAYPGSEIEVLMKSVINPTFRNVPLSTYQISDDGKFSISYMALLTGEYFLALKAKDKEGLETGIMSFNVNFFSEESLIVEDIFFPPTVGFKDSLIVVGDNVEIFGYAMKNSKIKLTIDDIIEESVVANDLGYYSFVINSSELGIGKHYVEAQQINTEGTESNFSFPRAFKVSTLDFPKADFNNDNLINVTDWSIFLFRWGSDDELLKSKIDLDDNGEINIVDFSIFLKNIKI